MKPQNYSLKFQNSLADCRIIPGSQQLVSRSNVAIPKGARALRRPTKAELRTTKGKVSKDISTRKAAPPATPLVQLLSKKAQKQAQAKVYAEQRAAEKRGEAESAASMKSILRNPTSTTAETKTK